MPRRAVQACRPRPRLEQRQRHEGRHEGRPRLLPDCHQRHVAASAGTAEHAGHSECQHGPLGGALGGALGLLLGHSKHNGEGCACQHVVQLQPVHAEPDALIGCRQGRAGQGEAVCCREGSQRRGRRQARRAAVPSMQEFLAGDAATPSGRSPEAGLLPDARLARRSVALSSSSSRAWWSTTDTSKPGSWKEKVTSECEGCRDLAPAAMGGWVVVSVGVSFAEGGVGVVRQVGSTASSTALPPAPHLPSAAARGPAPPASLGRSRPDPARRCPRRGWARRQTGPA